VKGAIQFLLIGLILVAILYYLNKQTPVLPSGTSSFLDFINKILDKLKSLLEPQAGDTINVGSGTTLTFSGAPYAPAFDQVSTLFGSNYNYGTTPLAPFTSNLPAGQSVLAVNRQASSLLGINQVEVGPTGTTPTLGDPTLPAALTTFGLLGYSAGSPLTLVAGDTVAYTPSQVADAASQSYGLLGYNPVPVTIYQDAAKKTVITPDVQTTIPNPIGSAARANLQAYAGVPIPEPVSVSDIQNADVFGVDNVPVSVYYPGGHPTAPVPLSLYATGGVIPLAQVNDLSIVPALSLPDKNSQALSIPAALAGLFNFFAPLPPISPANTPIPLVPNAPPEPVTTAPGVAAKYAGQDIYLTPWGQPYVITSEYWIGPQPFGSSYNAGVPVLRDPYTDALIATYDEASNQYVSVTNPSFSFSPTAARIPLPNTPPGVRVNPNGPFAGPLKTGQNLPLPSTPIQNITPLQAQIIAESSIIPTTETVIGVDQHGVPVTVAPLPSYGQVAMLEREAGQIQRGGKFI